MWDNTTKYLSADAESLMDVEKWSGMYHQDVAAASHLLMRFSMLDRLADAFGTPRQPSFVSSKRSLLPSLSRAFEKAGNFMPSPSTPLKFAFHRFSSRSRIGHRQSGEQATYATEFPPRSP
jgi:hypothetical protein